MYMGRMFSPTGRNVFVLLSVQSDDIPVLPV